MRGEGSLEEAELQMFSRSLVQLRELADDDLRGRSRLAQPATESEPSDEGSCALEFTHRAGALAAGNDLFVGTFTPTAGPPPEACRAIEASC